MNRATCGGMDNEGEESSRESGIGDPRSTNDSGEEPKEVGAAGDEDDEEDSVPASFVDDRDEAPKSKDDVKRLTGFDAQEAQQRRRNETLQWQRERRDELLDKIRQLEDSAFSDSEAEDELDFLQSVKQKKGPSLEQHSTLEEIFEEEGGGFAVKPEELLPVKSRTKQNPKQRNRKKGSNHEERMDVTPSLQREVKANRPQQQYHPHYHRTQPQSYNQRPPPPRRGGPCRPMLSEWLLEKPEDFEESWLGVLCPAGKRVIVLASRGKTKVFSRTDEYLGTYRSLLPGGCKYNYRDSTTTTIRTRGVTILDCIWSEQSQTFYVLDLICWNSHSCVNCDTDYRQFFLTSKFSENMELLERSQSNPFPFKPLPAFPTTELPLVLWSSVSFPEEIDGIVFFHKETFYVSETNPLCLWILLTQMEPILQMSVSPELLSRQKKVKNLSSRKKQQQLKKQQMANDQNQGMEVF